LELWRGSAIGEDTTAPTRPRLFAASIRVHADSDYS
jgi:hypothetical protein